MNPSIRAVRPALRPPVFNGMRPAQLPSQSKTTLRIGRLVVALSLALGSNAGHAGNLPVTSCLDDFGAGTLRLVMFGAANGDIVDLSQLSCADSKITLAHGAISSSAPNLSVIGPGQQALTIDGAGLSRVLVNTALQGTFSISGLTIANGHFHHSGGTALGGCIYGRYRVALDHVTVDSCTIDGAADADVVAGAGVAALGGPLSLTASTISNCSAAQGCRVLPACQELPRSAQIPLRVRC